MENGQDQEAQIIRLIERVEALTHQISELRDLIQLQREDRDRQISARFPATI